MRRIVAVSNIMNHSTNVTAIDVVHSNIRTYRICMSMPAKGKTPLGLFL